LVEEVLEFGGRKFESKKIRIILVDDHPLLRQALRDVVEKQPDFEVVAEAGDGEEAIKLAAELMPNVVIMDIGMPNLNGLEATKRIKASCPQIAVLALTVHSDSEHILGILKAGASGYLTKSVYGDEVIQAVRTVARGEVVLAPSVSEQVLKYALQNYTKPVNPEVSDILTTRELEIFRLLTKGISNKDIALRTNLGLRTVKGHITEIFLKLHVASRTQAAFVGLQKGILTLDDLK
jgi:two-component system, NarL family, response regulator LiaR